MNFREKIVTQAVICLMVFSAVRTAGMIDFRPIKDILDRADKLLSENYTAEDISEAVSGLLKQAGEARETLTSAVISANEAGSIEGELGEADEQGVQIVYAPAGGKVIGAGIDETIGMYVKIKHDEIISVCGNMATIAVLTGERVRKGDIIGTFDGSTGNEFYFGTEERGNISKISA